MPSLSDCVLDDVRDEVGEIAVSDVTDLFAHYDLDINAISSVEGSWESIPVQDRTKPIVEGLNADDFTVEGPSVFMVNDYMIVRGRELVHHVFFVYERTV